MKITFLGTNGGYDTDFGNTACAVLETDSCYLVFDAGSGFPKLNKYITTNKPIYLFISHFHLDHVSGLHQLFNFKQGIDVFLGKGRLKDFDTLVNPPFTFGYKINPKNIVDLRMEVRVKEVDDHIYEPIKISSKELFHGYVGHGYRIEIEGKVIVYTGDCGIDQNLMDLVSGADILITECSNRKIPEKDIWGHLDPTLAGKLANENSVKKLILTHFSPNDFKTLNERKDAEEETKSIFPNTIIGYDNLTVEI
jgi:ribonuclease BN (tRNA processing enzyme)